MNHTETVDHESKMVLQFRAEGKRLAHICPDWDFMAIHADMDEISVCCCDFDTEADNELRDQKAEEVNQKRMAASADPMRATNMMLEAAKTENDPLNFSSDGAPAHSGTDDLDNEVALVCMIVSNPGGKERPLGWQKRVNDLLRGMRDRIKELESK